MLDSASRSPRSAGLSQGRPPANKGRRYPADRELLLRPALGLVDRQAAYRALHCQFYDAGDGLLRRVMPSR